MSLDAAIVLDICKAAELIGEFVHGLDRAAFEKDVKTQSAVLHQIMGLGEAATSATVRSTWLTSCGSE